MTTPVPVPRKPVRSVGVAVPELMAQLGVSSWTNVPNPVLERWMAADYPPKLRILAALVRQSFGYQSHYCVYLHKGKLRLLRQADLQRLLQLDYRWIRRVWAELRREGCVTMQDRRIHVSPNPPAPALHEAVGRAAEASEAISDPEYLAEVAEAKRLYLHEISSAKARLAERLRLAGIGARERAERANLTLQNEGQLDPHFAPYKRKESEKKGAGGQYVQVETEEPVPPARLPAFPSPEVAELHRYLEGFSAFIGTAPDPAEAAEIHRRLDGASLAQFQKHMDNRLARGLRPHGWRIFRQLAADCAAGKEAFTGALALRIDTPRRPPVASTWRIHGGLTQADIDGVLAARAAECQQSPAPAATETKPKE